MMVSSYPNSMHPVATEWGKPAPYTHFLTHHPHSNSSLTATISLSPPLLPHASRQIISAFLYIIPSF